MKEVKRLKRIVAVRTTQRDISTMRLFAAKQKTEFARGQLTQAEHQLQIATMPQPTGTEILPKDLMRMDAARTAAWEEIAIWQEHKENAERDEESARQQVETQHMKLRQSERLGERAEQRHRAEESQAERQLQDEQAGRVGRTPF